MLRHTIYTNILRSVDVTVSMRTCMSTFYFDFDFFKTRIYSRMNIYTHDRLRKSRTPPK
jgi:hypothetical protein